MIEKHPEAIYILRLNNDKWYVGTTHNIEHRVMQHFKGNGCKWSKLHGVVEFITAFVGSREEENSVTLELMRMFGVDSVRGGAWSQIIINNSLIEKRLYVD